MTGKRFPPLGPTTRRFVAYVAEPIGNAASRAGASRTAAAIATLASQVGPLLVMSDPKDKMGKVYAVPNASERARAFETQQPGWIVGVFNRNAAASDIAEAILALRNQTERQSA